MNTLFPAELAKLQSRFEHWRSTRTTRSPIPEDLLQAARALLNRYSASMVCRACRLHPNSLRKPAAALARSAPTDKALSKSAALTLPAFYSLSPAASLLESPVPAVNADCRLVLERPDGTRLTLTVPQLDAAWLSNLCSDFLRG
jgi:hypothetical protein